MLERQQQKKILVVNVSYWFFLCCWKKLVAIIADFISSLDCLVSILLLFLFLSPTIADYYYYLVAYLIFLCSFVCLLLFATGSLPNIVVATDQCIRSIVLVRWWWWTWLIVGNMWECERERERDSALNHACCARVRFSQRVREREKEYSIPRTIIEVGIPRITCQKEKARARVFFLSHNTLSLSLSSSNHATIWY